MKDAIICQVILYNINIYEYKFGILILCMRKQFTIYNIQSIYKIVIIHLKVRN